MEKNPQDKNSRKNPPGENSPEKNPQGKQLQGKKLKGILAVLTSALLFYLATFFVKLGGAKTTADSILFLAARFWLGYWMLLLWYRLVKKVRITDLKVVNRKWLWYRAFWNTVAVVFFYLAVVFGSVTNANILNMTYPVFVALFSIYLLREKTGFFSWTGILLSVAGAVLVSVNPKEEFLIFSARGDLLALMSAITAGIAIVALKIIRHTDSTDSALFYNFRLGFWVSIVPVIYFLYASTTFSSFTALGFAILSGLSGVFGQAALTYGFRFVSAVEGSILSSTRLIFAVMIGYVFLQKEVTMYNLSGAFLIMAANFILARG